MAEFLETTLALVRAGSDLNLRQIAILSQIGATSAPPSVGPVADSLRINKPSVTRACDLLVTLGYVTREGSKTDRRQIALKLTASGRGLLERLREGTVVPTKRRRAA